jgi:hypothetical protein
MSVVLFHRTTIADARQIVRNGFEDLRWAFGHEDELSEVVKATGVWLSERPLEADEGPGGDAQLEVVLDLAEDTLSAFELDGVLWDTRLWVVPSAMLNPHASVRILEVDPRTSWWYERQDDAEGE